MKPGFFVSDRGLFRRWRSSGRSVGGRHRAEDRRRASGPCPLDGSCRSEDRERCRSMSPLHHASHGSPPPRCGGGSGAVPAVMPIHLFGSGIDPRVRPEDDEVEMDARRCGPRRLKCCQARRDVAAPAELRRHSGHFDISVSSSSALSRRSMRERVRPRGDGVCPTPQFFLTVGSSSTRIDSPSVLKASAVKRIAKPGAYICSGATST